MLLSSRRSGVVWMGVALSSVTVLVACGSDSSGGGGGGACARLSGQYSISGSCSATSCAVTQSGCALSMQCDDGTSSHGTFGASSLNFSSSVSRCSGSLRFGENTPASGQGTCIPTMGGQSCTFSATCLSGDCLSAVLPSGTGGQPGGGSPGVGGAATGGEGNPAGGASPFGSGGESSGGRSSAGGAPSGGAPSAGVSAAPVG